MRSAASRASTRRAGRGRRRISRGHGAGSRRSSRKRARPTPEKRGARFVAVLCLAFPDGRQRALPRRGRGHAGLAAARHRRLRLRPDVRAGRADADLRRDARRRRSMRCRTAPAPSPAFASQAEARATGPGEERRSARQGQRMSADPGFGVYVHWPFCAAKCPYCDFNSHVRHAPPDQARYAAAFAPRDRGDRRPRPGRTVSSIFLGGGTPSLMEPATVGAHPRRDRQALDRRPRCRDHARGQPVERRGGALPRLPRRRRQPRLARRPGAQRRRPPLSRPPAQCRRGAPRPSRSPGRPSRACPST